MIRIRVLKNLSWKFYLACAVGIILLLSIPILFKSTTADKEMDSSPGFQSGVFLVLEVEEKEALGKTLETIRNRLEQLDVKDADIRSQGGDRVLVQIPGFYDLERASSIVGQTARLEFKMVDESVGLEEAEAGTMPDDREIRYETRMNPSGEEEKIPYVVEKRAVMTGAMLDDVQARIGGSFGEPHLAITFNDEGRRLFEEITANNIKKRLAIVLDGKIHAAPIIQDRISGGAANVTGKFTMEEARDLALALRSGALPSPVKIVEARVVGSPGEANMAHETP